jgi:hypothetical protein
MPRKRMQTVIDVHAIMQVNQKKKKKEAIIIIMARAHLELLLLQKGDTNNIVTEQTEPLPVPRINENVVVGDGKHKLL